MFEGTYKPLYAVVCPPENIYNFTIHKRKYIYKGSLSKLFICVICSYKNMTSELSNINIGIDFKYPVSVRLYR